MKTLVSIVLLLLGVYWLLDHHAPLPLNHDSLGLHNHTIHEIIGVVLLGIGIFFSWRWNRKPQPNM